MINVGIVGSGFIVPAFIEATRLVKGFRYVAISSPHSEEKLKKMVAEYGMKYCSLNSDDLMKDPKIDVIYVATPNSTHYEVTKKALENGKHVIVEKPMTVSYGQAKELVDLAKKKKRVLFDATTTLHYPNYYKVKELLGDIGEIKMVNLNYSQYSSRYDRFKQGIILPAFDHKLAGGALTDLGIYNISFAVGLFGEPKKVHYYPNMSKKIDTSGLLVMDYGDFKINAVAAKDCSAPSYVCIQADEGYIRSDHAANSLMEVELVKKDGTVRKYRKNRNTVPHYHEFAVFKKMYNDNDLVKAQELNKITLKAIRVLEKALDSAGIKF